MAIDAYAFGSIPPEVVYAAQTFHIGAGVTMVLGAICFVSFCAGFR